MTTGVGVVTGVVVTGVVVTGVVVTGVVVTGVVTAALGMVTEHVMPANVTVFAEVDVDVLLVVEHEIAVIPVVT